MIEPEVNVTPYDEAPHRGILQLYFDHQISKEEASRRSGLGFFEMLRQISELGIQRTADLPEIS